MILIGSAAGFHPQTRAEIPYWPALLQLFAAELVPTLFACLFATNLIAYRRARINYVLIFEFDLRVGASCCPQWGPALTFGMSTTVGSRLSDICRAARFPLSAAMLLLLARLF